jgi:L-fuculose-phosphate aldolase
MINYKIINFPEQGKNIIWASAVVYNRGLVSAAGGNISARCDDAMLITRTNVSFRDVKNIDLVLCNLQGIMLDSSQGIKPSKELKFHIGLYRVREDVNYIIHVHPCYSILWSMQHKELPLYTESAKMKLGKIPIIPDGVPGSQELANSIVKEAIKAKMETNAFFLENHGIIVLGKTMEECLNTTELLEDTAKIAVYQELLKYKKG